MATTDLDSYHQLFIQSARDCLNILKSNFNAYITALPGQKTESLSEMFRMAHMIKGQAAAMGYQNTAQYCLTLQRIFQVIKEKNLTLSSNQINDINQAIAILEQNLNSIDQQKKELDFSTVNQLQDFLWRF